MKRSPVRKREQVTLTCLRCGKEFERSAKEVARRNTDTFCSKVCQGRYLGEKRSKRISCPICSTRFYLGSERARKTCSAKCARERKRRQREKKCVHCAKLFEAPPSQFGRKFCSPRCASASKMKFSPKNCECCGTEFQPYNHRPRRFCSKECQHKHTVGPAHHLWRGNRRQERGPTWKENSQIARDRDRACVGCGSDNNSEKLSVDHIIPFRLTVIYGAADGVDPNHIDNLASLCRSCHGKKTRIERRILSGDIVGFVSAVKSILPIDRVDRALTLWKLGRGASNTLMFDGVPKFMSDPRD